MVEFRRFRPLPMKRRTILVISILSAVIALILISLSSGASDRKRTEQLQQDKIQKQQQIQNLDKSIQELEQKFNDSQKKTDEQQKQIEDLNKQLSIKKEAQAKVASLQKAGGNCESYRPLFEQYGWNVNTAMAIMQAESGCRPTAISPTDDHGLMQINHGVEIYGQGIYDPATNIRIAYTEKYLKGGWRHWSVYNSGAYLKYLG